MAFLSFFFLTILVINKKYPANFSQVIFNRSFSSSLTLLLEFSSLSFIPLSNLISPRDVCSPRDLLSDIDVVTVLN
ncbi:hypothetical protein BY996DRAFT_6858208 [Phakopsora pachyrhizi]|nr:hypothetical protein BY996DRAFT_6858208 [Phakopsora pachyrhizi]